MSQQRIGDDRSICRVDRYARALVSCSVALSRYIGGLYGRAIGHAFIHMHGEPVDDIWQWIDPGVFALVGAASFFSGVTRLTFSLTIIIVRVAWRCNVTRCTVLRVLVADLTPGRSTFVQHSSTQPCIPPEYNNYYTVLKHTPQKADLRSLDFVIDRFFMKLFKTNDNVLSDNANSFYRASYAQRGIVAGRPSAGRQAVRFLRPDALGRFY